jgi:hypothetical protein
MGTAPAEEPLAALLFERFDFVLRTTRLQIPLRRLTNFASIFSPIFEAEKAEGVPFSQKVTSDRQNSASRSPPCPILQTQMVRETQARLLCTQNGADDAFYTHCTICSRL